jgi:hypothetical protein
MNSITLKRLAQILFFFVFAVAAQAADDFCWLKTQPRGAGTIPTACSNGKEIQDSLCYNKCPANTPYGHGPVCWSDCPSGYTSVGATCHINMPLTVAPTWVCTHHWPGWMGGGCRWKDTRCPSGYTNAGLFCALSARPTPAGYSGTYLDPMKNTYGRGAGTIPNNCGTKQNQAGLCYNACPSGSSGVGPVCWMSCPRGTVSCGLGCAKDTATCASVIADQTISTVGLVANILTFGSEHYAQSAEGAAKVAKTAEEMSKLEKALADAKKAWAAVKETKAYKAYKDGKAVWKDTEEQRKTIEFYKATEEAANTPSTASPEEITRNVLAVAAVADPTGVASVVGAYTYPVCK